MRLTRVSFALISVMGASVELSSAGEPVAPSCRSLGLRRPEEIVRRPADQRADGCIDDAGNLIFFAAPQPALLTEVGRGGSVALPPTRDTPQYFRIYTDPHF
jgi:hypothetical protein